MLLKRHAQWFAISILTYHFIYDSLNKIMNNNVQKFKFDTRVHNQEVTIFNKGLLLFDYAETLKACSSELLYIVGCLQLVAAVMLLKGDEYKPDKLWVHILIGCLAFDCATIHEPFTENVKEIEYAVFHFASNIALIGSLLMFGGVRNFTFGM
jgi:hypothetical protein